MPTLLEVADVHAGYGRIQVLRGMTFTVPEGAVVAVLGANGVGKTTALRTIAGVVPTTAGSVTFAGERIDGRSVTDIASRGLVMVPEGRGIFPGMTVGENLRVIHGGLGTGTDWAEFRDEVVGLFPRLGERFDQPAGSLSGGEQQMLAVSRAMAGQPRLVLFDELSMGLAPLIVDELYAQVAAMLERGLTVVLVEQFMTHALGLADVCYVVEKGRVAWAGEPGELERSNAADYLSR